MVCMQMNTFVIVFLLWYLKLPLAISSGVNRETIEAGISPVTLAKLGKGENVTTDVLLKICAALECGIADIMEIEQVNKL